MRGGRGVRGLLAAVSCVGLLTGCADSEIGEAVQAFGAVPLAGTSFERPQTFIPSELELRRIKPEDFVTDASTPLLFFTTPGSEIYPGKGLLPRSAFQRTPIVCPLDENGVTTFPTSIRTRRNEGPVVPCQDGYFLSWNIVRGVIIDFPDGASVFAQPMTKPFGPNLLGQPHAFVAEVLQGGNYGTVPRSTRPVFTPQADSIHVLGNVYGEGEAPAALAARLRSLDGLAGRNFVVAEHRPVTCEVIERVKLSIIGTRRRAGEVRCSANTP